MSYDLSPLLRQWIGFDKLVHGLENTSDNQGFPPYNIEKSDDNRYRITLALAGFRQQDLEIEHEGVVLRVKGTPLQPSHEPKWLHQGLVVQPFNLSFTLAENIEVSGASFMHGLLHIDLFRRVSQAEVVRRIAINEQSALSAE